MNNSPADDAQDFKAILGQNCQGRRKQLDISQKDLAKMIGYGITWMSNFENGKASLPAEHLPMLARALDSTIVDIYTEERYYRGFDG